MADDGNMLIQHKKQRISPPQTPNSTSRETDDNMDVTTAPTDPKSRAGSDVSSDWDDWADAMVAQGERPTKTEAVDAAGGGGNPIDRCEEDEWVRTMMEQPSVVLDADNHVWDYVLQMVVEEGEVGDLAYRWSVGVY